FLVGVREEKSGFKKKKMLAAKLAGKTIDEWLKDALTNHGLGAKTAVGYGYFRAE
ncbi:MAG: hypothetical protein HC880_20560, partial [Bacteroidia bacterium]|nr:hypothetical protein [Bacteroidia bacterium]